MADVCSLDSRSDNAQLTEHARTRALSLSHTHTHTHTPMHAHACAHTLATDCYWNKETLSLRDRLISLQRESVNSSCVPVTVHQQCLERTHQGWGQAVQLQVEDLSTELGELTVSPQIEVNLHYSDLYW